MSLCRSLLTRGAGMTRRVPAASAVGGCGWAAFVPLSTSRRAFFVRFQSTPNDACYKFYVEDRPFLPPSSSTMMFDRSNDYQSPLAHVILSSLPMVEEVTIGNTFVTVKRVEEAHAAAAARYFAMKFHGVSSLEETPEDAAARSEALQARVDAAMADEEPVHDSGTGADAPLPDLASSVADGAATEGEPENLSRFDLGGFTVEKGQEEEAIDEAALEALIAATDWSELKLHVSGLITDHLVSGEPHISPDAPHPHADTLPQEGDSEVVLMLKELISTTIRPQLQDDGGDIRFVRYDPEEGVMEVEMLGACRTCKSSKTTLVDLIERSTRHWVPEVQTVREVRRAASPFEAFLQANQDDDVPQASPGAFIEEDQEDLVQRSAADGVTDAAGRVKVLEASADSGHRVLREVKATSDTTALP